MAALATGADGIAVMHHFETCVLRAYPDPYSALGKELRRAGLWQGVLAGRAQIPTSMRRFSGAPWTIGWGDTGSNVAEGLVITQIEADARFQRRLQAEFEPGVAGAVTRPCSQRQFDAMVCLAYNIGVDAFRGSSVCRLHNQGAPAGAAEAFLLWTKSGGEVSLGLKRRRAAERVLYLGGDATAAISASDKVTA